MATVIFEAAPAGNSFTEDEGEEVHLRHRAQLYLGETLNSTGELIISTRCAHAACSLKQPLPCAHVLVPTHPCTPLIACVHIRPDDPIFRHVQFSCAGA
jgi:hypothetical protein